jgi:hypothetical protein
MKQAVVTIKYDEEKLNAVKQYMGKKDADFDAELKEVLGKMYEKYVPQAVREYIESRGDVPPAIKKAIDVLQTKVGRTEEKSTENSNKED